MQNFFKSRSVRPLLWYARFSLISLFLIQLPSFAQEDELEETEQEDRVEFRYLVESPVRDWYQDTDNDTIVGLDADGTSAHFCHINMDGTIDGSEIELASPSRRLLKCGKYWLSFSGEPNEPTLKIDVYSADSLQFKKTIQLSEFLNGRSLKAVTATKSPTPYLYLFTGSPDGSILQIDAATNSLRNKVKMNSLMNGLGNNSDYKVSFNEAGTKLIINRTIFNVSESEFKFSRPYRVTGLTGKQNEFVGRLLFNGQSQIGRALPGAKVSSLPEQRLRLQKGVAIHPRTLQVAEVRQAPEDGLEAEINYELILRKEAILAPTPKEALNDQELEPQILKTFERQNGEEAGSPRLMWTMDNYLVVAFHNQLTLVRAADLVARTPRLLVDAQIPPTWFTRDRLSIPLTHRKRDNKRITYELIESPKGAKIENGSLVWTPAVVGTQKFILTAESGKQTDLLEFFIDVSHSHTRIDHRATIKATSESGNLVATLSKSQMKLDVVDLINRDVKKSVQSPTKIDHIVLTDRYLVLGFNQSAKLRRFDLKNPDQDPVDILIRDRIVALERAEGSKTAFLFFSVVGDRERVWKSILRLDEFKASEPVLGYRTSNPKTFRDGVLLDGTQLIDAKTSKVVADFDLNWLPPIYFRKRFPSRSNNEYSSLKWNRQIESQSLVTSGGKRLDASFPAAIASSICESLPALAQIQLKKSGESNLLKVEFRELNSSKLVHSINLESFDRTKRIFKNPCQLWQLGNVAIARLFDRVYRLELETDWIDQMERPFVIQPIPKFLFDVRAEVRVPISIEGGDGETKVVSASKHVSYDSQKRELIVATQKIVDEYLRHSTGRSVFEARSVQYRDSNSVRLFDNSEMFQKRCGHQLPDGHYAFRYPIKLSAEDTAGNISDLLQYIVLLVPKSNLTSLEERLVRTQKRIRPRSAPVAKPARLQPSEQPSGKNPNEENSNDRVKLLEERMDRLESKLDEILELLKRKN